MGTQTLICSECGRGPNETHEGHQFAPMTPAEVENFANTLVRVVARQGEMAKLTNRELAHKVLSLPWDDGDEDLLAEVCTRLDPGWENR